MAGARRRCIAHILSHACIPHEQILRPAPIGDGNTCMNSTIPHRNANGAQFAHRDRRLSIFSADRERPNGGASL